MHSTPAVRGVTLIVLDPPVGEHLHPERMRQMLFGPVASDSTCWRLLDALDAPALARVAAARARARAVAWAQRAETTGVAFGRSQVAGTPGLEALVIDLDAHIVVCQSEKQQADVDIASERLLVDGLLRNCPDHGLLGEEGTTQRGTSGWIWVIDPLDGTRNYISGTGPWSISIALQEHDDT